MLPPTKGCAGRMLNSTGLSGQGAVRPEAPEHREQFLSHHVADALPRAATARVLAKTFQIVAVVEAQLLARRNVAARHDPDAAVDQRGIAVRYTTVVDEPRGIPADGAVEVMLIIERKDAGVVPLTTRERFRLGDLRAGVFDYAHAGRQVRRGKHSQAVDRGRQDFDGGIAHRRTRNVGTVHKRCEVEGQETLSVCQSPPSRSRRGVRHTLAGHVAATKRKTL